LSSLLKSLRGLRSYARESKRMFEIELRDLAEWLMHIQIREVYSGLGELCETELHWKSHLASIRSMA
jgi:hypothetical protein